MQVTGWLYEAKSPTPRNRKRAIIYRQNRTLLIRVGTDHRHGCNFPYLVHKDAAGAFLFRSDKGSERYVEVYT